MTALIETKDLQRTFSVSAGMFKPRQPLHAVNGVDLTVQRKDVLGIVGESGCGKSTLARMLLGLTPPSRGSILIDGQDISKIDRRELARRVQPIFQDPYSSLNPRRTIASLVAFPLDVLGAGTSTERRHKAIEMLDRVGLPARYADNTPGQLSGGQRQRVAIARALVINPEIVICDEPTSALDVSVQAQILNLLLDLRKEFNLTYVFISHNLAVVEHIATQVAVMYLGRIVELATRTELFSDPKHPYTSALLSAVPVPDPEKKTTRIVLQGDVPSPVKRPTGCHFHTRCPEAIDICKTKEPKQTIWPSGRMVACHLREV